QNVARIYDYSLELARRHDGDILFVGIDGLDFETFHRSVSTPKATLIPLTANVPSTSASSWTSIFTGMLPFEHGVYGAAQYHPQAGDSINSISALRYRDGALLGEQLRDTIVNDHPGGNLFERVRQLGFEPVIQGFSTIFSSEPLVKKWLRGGAIDPLEELETLMWHPRELVKRNIADIDRIVGRESPREKRFVFCFVDFDEYLHKHGYDQSILSAVEDMFAYLNQLKRSNPNISIFCASDHGMTPHRPYEEAPLIRDGAILQESRAFPAGAGRILFFYPIAGRENELRRLLEERIGNNGRIMSREEFISRYYDGRCVFDAQRIGDLVAVATSHAFPAAYSDALFEHGGLEEKEMIAAIAII
ncbi:MAG: alkaline phosphatase family protein, partial [Nocardioidaceae bacterium]|nr:alkaline phosphatase family protein [Nocardioidaceae bacterium]